MQNNKKSKYRLLWSLLYQEWFCFHSEDVEKGIAGRMQAGYLYGPYLSEAYYESNHK